MDPRMNATVDSPRRLPARMGACGAVLAVLLSAGPAATVSADPPCWAPAHGHQAKHGGKKCGKHYKHKKHHKHHKHHGHDEHNTYNTYNTRNEYPEQRDRGSDSSGISVGGLVGAAVGGYAGSHLGGGKGKLAATAGGAVAGYLVGQEIEKD